jgi:hypothetical protein
MRWAVWEASEVRREGRPGDGEGERYWLECFLPLGLGGVDTDVGWTGCGLGRGGGLVSSMGMRKQKQKVASFFGFGRAILVGRFPFPLALGRPELFGGFWGVGDSVRMRPRRSASVSMLVRSSRIGVWDILGPGLDFAEALAWSLCCQQYRLSSVGSSVRMPGLRREPPEGSSVAAIGRLHGRPLEVMPLHVVDGFLESERPSRDSGVLA